MTPGQQLDQAEDRATRAVILLGEVLYALRLGQNRERLPGHLHTLIDQDWMPRYQELQRRAVA